MSLLVWPMKKGNLRPYLQIQLFNPDDTPMDLTGSTVTFRMGDLEGTPTVDDAAIMVLSTEGLVEYRWQAGDTDIVGEHRAEFVVDGVDTYPKSGYILVVIEDTIGT